MSDPTVGAIVLTTNVVLDKELSGITAKKGEKETKEENRTSKRLVFSFSLSL